MSEAFFLLFHAEASDVCYRVRLMLLSLSSAEKRRIESRKSNTT